MLTSQEVRHIALLARVAVSDPEVERLRAQLSSILAHFETLNQVATEGVPPTGHAVPLQNVTRPDEPAPSFPRADILANAPLQDEDAFRVRAVLEF
ncbi:MAG: Asp-tRNA(Asn)/Glu-tRNA(Gln) amidotransferase subunit GatC [Chloroflexi bacterium]|nr:Asp-tRNA(Asn)/Glu-tRNA(Gln) amidotransferase subunit GatC [Chloroflexota bacterium]